MDQVVAVEEIILAKAGKPLVRLVPHREPRMTRRGGQYAGQIEADGFSLLPVTVDHAARSLTLPALHEDPFDRLLVAQAIAEGLVMVTRDGVIRDYPLAVMRA